MPVNAVPTLAAASRRRHWMANRRITTWMLLLWVLVTFLVPYNARALSFSFFGWPFSFWVAAQGTLLVYLALVVGYATWMAEVDEQEGPASHD